MSVLEKASPSGAKKSVPSAEELVARARALAPKLKERAVQCERDRQVPVESVREYIDAGLMRTLLPKRWGGWEHDHEVQFNIAIELGRSTCGSSAWCLNYLTDHLCMVAHFPEEAQHDVLSGNPDACVGTSAAPTGKAEIAPGGYRLNGKWAWASGIRHMQWMMIGGLVHRPGDNHPDMRLFLVPVSDLKVLDTWHCAGLKGSGSNTVVLDDVFVPEHRSLTFATMRDSHSPGSATNPNPIYKVPFVAVHSYALLGPALGAARGAYKDFTQWTRKRLMTYTTLAVAQHAPVQIRVAEIAAQIDAAELLARRCFTIARKDYANVPMEDRILLRRDFLYAMKLIRKAMDELIQISGSSGLLEDNSVQRAWRDVHTISSHVMMNWDVAAENFGRTELGLGRNESYPAF